MAAISYFDQTPHSFTCPNPQCGQVFQEPYRRLLHLDEVACPACGTTIDMRESKRTGEIGLWFNTIAELDKKANEKE
jgi:hydrogenase maturation factor HypF (carbamoyltransferase family)